MDQTAKDNRVRVEPSLMDGVHEFQQKQRLATFRDAVNGLITRALLQWRRETGRRSKRGG